LKSSIFVYLRCEIISDSMRFLSGQIMRFFLVVENFLKVLMKIQRLIRKLIVCLSFAVAPAAFAQASKVTAEKPTFDDLPSPEFSGGKQKSFKPKDWLEVEAKINVQLKPEPPSKTAPEVIVKWYIAVKNPEKSGTYFLLSKTVTHINVPLNEDVFSSVYLSPASIMRLTGSSKGGKNAVEYVGFEVLVNGEVKASDTNKGEVGWWKSPKLSATETVPLLAKYETPFAVMWWDRYAEVKQEK
jgi:hypothetical protein